jgi:hypothetical protein
MTADLRPSIIVPSGRESSRVKGARILIESRLTVVSVHNGRVAARCRGDEQTYNLGFNPNGRGWWCHCPARGKCSHLVALAHVIDVSAWEGGSP